MRYRVYSNMNIDRTTSFIFATYFKTKKEAIKYGETLKLLPNVTTVYVERKVVTSWVSC